MDALDIKLNQVFDGKLVRKDLLHRIKKGTNVPTFVLEFLLAKYCASNDEAEINAGMEAVLTTLQENYVRADESNHAQSKVATQGKHRFIDKIHVRYVETEKRHWAALENFNSQRIAINHKFYKDNERILEGGIWAEVTIAHNEVEEDNYAFYIEDLRPVQLSRFDFQPFIEGRKEFSRDEWLDAILRSVGLEPSKLSKRVKFHFISRLAPLVEPNFNFVELGPRGTGKSYFYSEFSPYSTLISGGQATKATLFYNNARGKVGLVGFWDTVAFDEVAGIKIRDSDTIQIMKDFMANGRFSRGVEIIADASLAFVGNIDLSIEQIVNSTEHDLFQPMPKEFDLAVMDRFASYLPGWEMPKNSSEFLTVNFGFITDYLAEAFHYMFQHSNRYEEVSKRVRLGSQIEGRDEKSINKTLCAFLKILHPNAPPSDEEFDEYVAYAVECRRRVKEQMNKRKSDDEFDEYVAYAVECRRRVKEQMNKRKSDDEFAKIDLSFTNTEGDEVIVFCPESKEAWATLSPVRKTLNSKSPVIDTAKKSILITKAQNNNTELIETETAVKSIESPGAAAGNIVPAEKHFTIKYDEIGYTYESLIGDYLSGVKIVTIEDPYIRITHQIANFVRFCEALIKLGNVKKIVLITGYDEETPIAEVTEKLTALKQSLLETDVFLDVQFDDKIHDREIRFDTGWTIKIGRGLDFYQKPNDWFEIGANDLSLRKCLETKVDIFKVDTL